MSDVAMMSLIATGTPDSGPGRRATSTGRYSNALSTGSGAFAFSRQTAAPDSGAKRVVGSVMSKSPGKTGLAFVRLCNCVSSPRQREMAGEPAGDVPPHRVEFRRRHLARSRKVDTEIGRAH